MILTFLILALGFGLLLFAVLTEKAKPRKTRRQHRVGYLDREFVAFRWTEIQAKANRGAIASAVTDADTLLDYALKHSGARGETMGDRLRSARSRFHNNHAVWEAHKLRNALVHEADFDVTASHAREALHAFEQGLKDLGAL